MKIVNIIGGLGNQLFQYAFAIALQAEFPDDEVKVNTRCFRGYHLHNGYELDRLFEVKLPQASIFDLLKFAYPWINYKIWQVGHKLLPMRKYMINDISFKGDFNWSYVKNTMYFDGYWQSEKFFWNHKEEIKKAFKFPIIKDRYNLNAINFIKSKPTAFIHIRRGDYLNNPLYKDICTKEYYKQAIEILKMRYNYNQFIIFSNDIMWCKNNFSNILDGTNTVYSDWNKDNNSHFDIQLMSKCDAGIIANSSFSWWGAWLSDAKVIICPHKWINDARLDLDIIPNAWIRI